MSVLAENGCAYRGGRTWWGTNVFPFETIVRIFVELTCCVQILYWRNKRPKIVRTNLKNKAESPVPDTRWSHPWVSTKDGFQDSRALTEVRDAQIQSVRCAMLPMHTSSHEPQLSGWLLVPNPYQCDINSHHNVSFGKSWGRCLSVIDTVYKLFLISESGRPLYCLKNESLKWVDKGYKKLVVRSFHFPWLKSSLDQPVDHWITYVTNWAHEAPLEYVPNQEQQQLFPEPPSTFQTQADITNWA